MFDWLDDLIFALLPPKAQTGCLIVVVLAIAGAAVWARAEGW